jgi:catechol 2,3-dioxygenase-like lactoylglutathione lyase family enzyme
MRFKGINHVGVRVTDMARAERFYIGILGLQPDPERKNWLGFDQGCPVHLMHATVNLPAEPVEPSRHFALEVERLETVVDLLLHHRLQPFQADVNQQQRHYITSSSDPLDFGIGTVFIEDPDGNVVEFIQQGRGIFAEVAQAVRNRYSSSG